MNSLFPSPGQRLIDGVADVEALIASRLIIQGASGAGKSYAIRRILETASGQAQQIIFDVEDEFGTLRELPGSSYIIIGGDDGDVPLRTGAPDRLATQLLETGASAIIQLNDLELDAQRAFIGRFVASLMKAPRRLWRPLLIVLDEGHRYSPNGTIVESSGPITHLATAGRKRGFGLVVATQRMPLLSPDVRGQCQNSIIGRVNQQLDRIAACEVLGFKPSSREGNGLMRLKHQFWTVGPALADEPELVKFSPALTTHGSPGQLGVAIPPPSDGVASLLERFAAIEPDAPEPEAITQEQLNEAFAKGREEGIAVGYAAAAQRAVETMTTAFPEAKAKQRGRPRIVSTEEVAA